MIDAFYLDRTTTLHRLPAIAKLAVLFVLGTVLFLIDAIVPLAGVFGVLVLLYVAARVPPRVAVRQLKYAALLLAVIAVAQGLLVSWPSAAIVLLRFSSLILAASLVSMTTRTMDMIAAFETVMTPLRYVGVDVARVGLALTLTIRFIPVLAQAAREVRDAQRARGVKTGWLTLITPVTVRMLRMADDVADALDARGYGRAER